MQSLNQATSQKGPTTCRWEENQLGEVCLGMGMALQFQFVEKTKERLKRQLADLMEGVVRWTLSLSVPGRVVTWKLKSGL